MRRKSALRGKPLARPNSHVPTERDEGAPTGEGSTPKGRVNGLPRKATMKRGRLAARSAKTKDKYEREGGRRDVVAAMLQAGPLCAAGYAIGGSVCARLAVDVHEILPRSAGGSIVDATNLLRVCRACHRWIHEHPKEARALGLLASRYDRTDDDT